MNNLAEQLATSLKAVAHAYAAGDQVAPCAVLWADPDRLWECVMPMLQSMLPWLFLLGSYAPSKHGWETAKCSLLWLITLPCHATPPSLIASESEGFYRPRRRARQELGRVQRRPRLAKIVRHPRLHRPGDRLQHQHPVPPSRRLFPNLTI